MLENSSKTQKQGDLNPELSEYDIKNLKAKLYAKLKDFVTLDVITIKGDFKIKNIDREKTDIIDIAKALGDDIQVLAQTHIQIDGDTLNAIPTDSVGKVSNSEIMEFHQKTVENALQNRRERLSMLLELISKVKKKSFLENG